MDILGFWVIALPITEHVVPKYLCDTNTRQLELLFWRARPKSSTSSQCLPLMASLNKRKRQHLIFNFIIYTVQQYKEFINLAHKLGCQALLSRAVVQLSNTNTAQTVGEFRMEKTTQYTQGHLNTWAYWAVARRPHANLCML